MLRPRWYKAFNDLLSSRTRTLLIVLSMSVGLFAVGMVLSASSILSVGLARSFAAVNPASGTLRTTEPFNEDFLKSVRAMPEIQGADARHSFQAQIETQPGEWNTITIFAISDYSDIRVNKVLPQSGVWPPEKHEILIERSALPLIDAQIGDTVQIKLANNTVRQMRIAGSAHDPVQLPARFSGSPYGYVSLNDLEWLGESYGFNELHIIVATPEDKIWVQQVIDRVKDKAERAGYTVPVTTIFEPGELPMFDVLRAILALSGILGVLSLFLSVFLVVSTVSALLAQQKRQIGVMKAIGGSTLQIFGMYMAMVIAYGVLALLIAIPFSALGARVLSQMLAGFFNFDLTSMEIPLYSILLQVGVGLVLPVLASLWPFLSNLRMSAVEVMSNYGLGKGRFSRSLIDRVLSGPNLWFTRKIPIRSILLAVRNTFRSKGRLALTLITLTLGAATFIGVFSVHASLTQTVTDLIQYMHFDVMLSFDHPHRSQEAQNQAKGVPGATQTDTLLQFSAVRVRPDGTESDGMNMFAVHIDDSSLIRSPAISEGRWLLPEDQNAIVIDSGLLQKEPDLRLGDEIRLKINDKEHSFKIVGVSVGSTFASFIYSNYAYLARITNRVGETDALLVTTARHDSASQEAGSLALQQRFQQLGIGIRSAYTFGSMRSQTEVIFDAIVALLIVMAMLMALVGGLGLMGAMSINVLERRREIGVLRAIGAPNRSVAGVFILEGVAIGVMSWFLGSLLAIPIGKILSLAIGTAIMGVPLTFSYSVLGLWLWLLIVVILSALSSFIPARNAARLTVREVLAYE
ncbi:MAG TPA: FtsX-like permease family protein [Anaerolineales bacterium]|nr:FtsX-like permease family protein [Anaerolineales bacterium]